MTPEEAQAKELEVRRWLGHEIDLASELAPDYTAWADVLKTKLGWIAIRAVHVEFLLREVVAGHLSHEEAEEALDHIVAGNPLPSELDPDEGTDR